MSEAIEVRDVFRVHQTAEGDAAALQGLSLTVREGETVTVLGPSGSGKSTFLRLLAGLDRPSAGSVRVFGEDVGKLTGRALGAYRSGTIGYAPDPVDNPADGNVLICCSHPVDDAVLDM